MFLVLKLMILSAFYGICFCLLHVVRAYPCIGHSCTCYSLCLEVSGYECFHLYVVRLASGVGGEECECPWSLVSNDTWQTMLYKSIALMVVCTCALLIVCALDF